MGTNIYAKYFHFCKKLSFLTQLEAHYTGQHLSPRSLEMIPQLCIIAVTTGHYFKKKKKRICGGICLPCQQLCLITHLYRWDRF